MQFVDAVNRILRMEGIIRGDDDNISDFSSTQHAASIESAKIAVQNEIQYLAAYNNLPYESAQDVITLVIGQRLYTLASDFIQFRGRPFLLQVTAADVSLNNYLSHYPGGETDIQHQYLDYQSNPGNPSWFYLADGNQKKVGFYPVPTEVRYYRYYYQKSVMVSTETDTLPFSSTEEDYAFVGAAAERFKFLRLSKNERDALFPEGIDNSPLIEAKRAALLRTTRSVGPTGAYGRRYG